MSCLTTETLERLALDFLQDGERAQAHVDSCIACEQRLRLLRRDFAVLARAARTLPGRRRAPMALLWKPLALAAAAHLIALAALFLLIEDSGEEELALTEPPVANVREENFIQGLARSKDVFHREVLRDDVTLHDPTLFLPDSKERDHHESADFLSYVKGDAGGSRGRNSGVYDSLAVGTGAGRYGGRMGGKPGRAQDGPVRPDQDAAGGMTFKDQGTNPTVLTSEQTQSTFGLDVDTASYTKIRDFIVQGSLPPKEAVRVEECVNYFKYADPKPAKGPFSIRIEAAPSPFNEKSHLVRIALQTREILLQERKNVVLTFIIDVSGSMAMDNRLGLVKRSLTVLVDQLRPVDQVGIVVYGSTARTVLPPTPVAEGDRILAAIHALSTEGSTNLEQGLNVGYDMAARNFDPKATNRVVLCTDGVANNGVTDPILLVDSVKEKAAKGIWLSVFGFGMNNYNDHLMVTLANKGNGNYAYIDDFQEGRKVFTEKLAGLFEVVAADAKVQVEFHPAAVDSFRQIGYEKRRLRNEDFRNDKIDAGELGAGHHVTALYEIALRPGAEGRLATVRLRFRDPATKEMIELQESIGRENLLGSAREASASYRLAAAVAQFAEILRDSPHARNVKLSRVSEEAHAAANDLERPADAVEFVGLVKRADALRR